MADCDVKKPLEIWIKVRNKTVDIKSMWESLYIDCEHSKRNMTMIRLRSHQKNLNKKQKYLLIRIIVFYL